MKLGSLFDGAGTFPFAGSLFGIIPIWASEIENFPINVTKKRFPNMKHLGDITKISGENIEPVDIITFGSPCQNLSIAGNRKGLEGNQSGLFTEAIRIIKEMRNKTNGKQPRYAIWENVPGAFSSNQGEDFRIVLEEFCKIKDKSTVIPRPTESKGKWRTSGLILGGNNYSIAWRVLDAQFWGVPQRRRRIFLVADFGGESAGEILFKHDGLQRSFAKSRETWNGITTNTTYGAYLSRETEQRGFERARDNLSTNVISLDSHPNDSRIQLSKDNKVQTLTSRMGTRGGNTPYVLVKGVDLYNQSITNDKSKTLLSSTSDCYKVPCTLIYCSTDETFFSLCENKSPCLKAHDAKNPIYVCYPPKWIVRRVIPKECARLQGMPDWWCNDIEKRSDSAEYKMWGNGMALPCVMYVMQGIALQQRKELMNRLKGDF